ncbi:MAG: NAD-dependent epimerase/dehydratase [Candidatus Marinimicrobia bacterium]|nr:NAD-dependent epimerase/dehydratase [Candidatus Neomarinimicrobiota bacterium]
MKILLLGGGGYVGTPLTEKLLENKRNKITVVDTFWFGNFLKKNKRLKVIKKDIRNVKIEWFKGIDSVIHLANIANDPAVDLNPNLSWDVNVVTSIKIIKFATKCKVKKFIYASSGSVYGVKKEKNVTEDLDLVPISIYNKTKMVAERVFMSFKDKIHIYCIRPATVCGISPRMRYDVSVNLLTLQAIKKKKITVLGGNQTRPNIHIKDMIRLYEFFLKRKIPSGFYNAGFENLKINKIAKMIQKKTNAKINVIKSNDPRSYRQDSTKITKLGFKTMYGVRHAIEDLIDLDRTKKIKVNQSNYTVKWMKKLKIQ